MRFLHQRQRQPEIMDQPGLSPERHAGALAGLARLNFWSRSAGIVWPALAAAARRQAPRPLRVLDIATGGGDVPVRLARRALRAGVALDLEGCDVSSVALACARQRAERAGLPVRFFVHDALGGPLPSGYDAVMCSLFLHHLDDADAGTLLGRMAAAAPLVLVNDLERGLTELTLTYLATRLLSRSDVVHTDGPLSVRAAFTLPEIRALAATAALTGAVVARRWPCRFLLTWGRS
jgi:SAM-dependent methyltransferase